jgi:hypothetical protein
MEQPPTDDPSFDPALLKGTWWNDFNKVGLAKYGATSEAAELPTVVRTANDTFHPNHGGLDDQGVGWNLTCLSSDGSRRLRGPKNLPGGSRSGSKGCGEDSLWSVSAGANKKNVAKALGSAEFGYLGVVYLIDAGLCPCLRCCGSLLGLASRTKSTIVVRPRYDYELISKSRTQLADAETFLLVFQPAADTFLVFHTAANEAPLAPSERDVSAHPTQFWCRCSQPACRREFTVVYPAEKVKASALKQDKVLGASVKVACPHCGHDGLAPIIAKATGNFPATVVNKGYY